MIKRNIKTKILSSVITTSLLCGMTNIALADDINININKLEPKAGIEIGNNSTARGEGAIATGTNAMAYGTNAVATGGNESKDSILGKLRENQNNLDNIKNQKNTVNRLTDELDVLNKKNRAVIEAGIRVEQVRQAKEKAKQDWQAKLQAYNEAKTNSAEFLAENQRKIDDLNSRLTGVGNIPNFDISSEQSLTETATRFKEQVERDTTLNLTVDFYKDYIQSYYKALGDLRQNNIIVSLSSFNEYSNKYSAGNSNINNPFAINSLTDITSPISYSSNAFNMKVYNPKKIIEKNIFSNSINTSIEKPKYDLLFYNYN